MMEKVKSHFTRRELKSIMLSFIAALMVEQAAAVVWGGDLSREALVAFGFAALKSMLTAIFNVEIKPLLTETTTTTIETDADSNKISSVTSTEISDEKSLNN